jgi:hypothetical protein
MCKTLKRVSMNVVDGDLGFGYEHLLITSYVNKYAKPMKHE